MNIFIENMYIVKKIDDNMPFIKNIKERIIVFLVYKNERKIYV